MQSLQTPHQEEQLCSKMTNALHSWLVLATTGGLVRTCAPSRTANETRQIGFDQKMFLNQLTVRQPSVLVLEEADFHFAESFKL